MSRKKRQVPNTAEMSEKEKIKYYKGQLKKMDKILNNIEKRLKIIEKKLSKVKIEPHDITKPDDVKGNSFNKNEFLKKYNPSYQDKGNK